METMRGKYCYIILTVLIIYNLLLLSACAPSDSEEPQDLATESATESATETAAEADTESNADSLNAEEEEKKPLEYFVQDNQLGAQWPHGIIPYYLDLHDYDYLVSRRVRIAMNQLEDSSCIKFKALQEAKHFAPWIHIGNPDKVRDCVHDMENQTDVEIPLVLGYECLQRRDILHSLMHAIGFKDEVTHPQRDQYVRVQWENINPKYQALFRLKTYREFSPVKIEYDTSSIMHFHDRAYSRNGQATIAPLIPGLVINPSGDLSPLDKMKLRMIFGHECNKRRVGDLLDSCKMVMRNEPESKDTTNQVFNKKKEDIHKGNEDSEEKKDEPETDKSYSDNENENDEGEKDKENNEADNFQKSSSVSISIYHKILKSSNSIK